ncbi:sperm flagellar protein 2-like [Onthophagus taurus]|uniref:sperm flagellar protein 2-like n=1 Tax=Onthophagus taurus TaxID=166361 RepID=UPI0039BE524F
MGDVITQWLRDKLGVIVDVHDDSFLEAVLNGHLIALLLRQYNIITEKQLKTIHDTHDTLTNITRVTLWLKCLDPSLEEDAINCFTKNKLSSTVKLFYKLYLVLTGKDQLHYTTQNVIREKLRSNNRFKCTIVTDEYKDIGDDIQLNPLSQPLQDQAHIIQWHRDRYRALLERCKEARNAYIASIEKSDIKPSRPFRFRTVSEALPIEPESDTFDVLSLSETYDELKTQEKNAQEIDLPDPNPREAQKIVKKLKNKFKREQEERAMKSQMETIMVTKIWNETVRQQEEAIEMELSKKILKQSNYEKQMANKLFEIREQKQIMAQNRLLIQREMQKQADDAILKYVFVKEKESGDERSRYYLERDRTLELHRRIYAQKIRLMKERRLQMCTEALRDMVDIAIRDAEYKEAFDEEMSPKMKKDLADLFVKGKSIFDVVEDVETIIDYMPIDDFDDEIVLEEIDRQNTLDIRNFEDYCNFVWPYEIDAHASEFVDKLDDIKLAMNILGHVIFRLLLTKYPKPALPTPPNIPKVEVAACIANIPDLTVVPILEKLLVERKIKVIQLEDTINYCLEAYKMEITVEAPESQFVSETQVAIEDVKKDKKNKDKKKPPPKGTKPGKKGKEVVEIVPEELPFKDQMIQTPRLFPCEEIKLTQKAELGKIAYEVLNLGEPLSDETLVKMFVEYLKTFSGIYGWVLINYPKNFDQAVLLEEALTAKKVSITQSYALEPQNLEEEFHPEEQETVFFGTFINEESCNCTIDQRTITSGSVDDYTFDAPTETPLNFDDYLCHPKPQPSCKSTDKCVSFSVDPETVQFSRKEPVLEDFVDISSRDVEQKSLDYDKNAQYRVSLLLTNPDVVAPVLDYDTYLTALIKVQQDIDSLPNPHIIDMDKDMNILTPLDIFYQNQGCHYTLYYKTLDFAAIKHLGKLIIGEYKIPPKTSVQLFGDIVEYLEAEVPQPDAVNQSQSVKKGEKAEKKEQPKTQAPKPDEEPADKGSKKAGKGDKADKGKGDKKGKQPKIAEEAEVVIERADKETQIPTPVPETIVDFVEMIPPNAGDEDYIYVDLPIDDDFQICLATIWENVEEVYVYDFRELFFRRRVTWRTVVPYMDFVRRYMRDFIARPDDKQIHVFNFQKIYNSIDEDLRDDDEMKSELHCQIHEFREKLWEICDQRMQEAEQERINIILQDWLAKQASELSNVYVTAMQLEVDRCCDTMQLLNDYYAVMITKIPGQCAILDKVFLNQICLTAYMDFPNAENYKIFVREMLTNIDYELGETPYQNTINDDFQNALSKTLTYEDMSLKEIKKYSGLVQPGGGKGKGKDKGKDKGKGKGKDKGVTFTDPPPEVLEQVPKLLSEWTAVIQGEKLRTLLRLNMLFSLYNEDITDMFTCGINTFHGLYNDIKERYQKEMDSVESCCDVISRAVEEEVSIQPQLILRGPDFYIDPNVMLFEDPLPMSTEITTEYEQPDSFTIDQLTKLVTIMIHYAPRGIVPEQAFLFVLQDMIVFIPDDGGIPTIPELWRKLSYKGMNRLCHEFYGNVEKVDWRDFILYNLCIKFPSEDEIMDMRRQFRELDEDKKEFVYDYQYDSIRFWFEKEFDNSNPQDFDRFKKIKKILFRIYALDAETVNYTALLLGFCKGATTIEGVAKALALSIGKLVCHQMEIGQEFVETLRERKRQQLEEELLFELQEKEKHDIATDIIISLIDTTVHECDSCIVTDIIDPDDPNQQPPPNVGIFSESMEYLDRLIKRYGPVDYFDSEHEGEFYQDEFTNYGEIGHEAYKNPPLVYYLLYDHIFTVLMATMPWRAIVENVGEITFRQKLENVYEELKNPEFDDIVLMHEFLNSIQFEELMECTQKFKIINPRVVIRNLLGDV